MFLGEKENYSPNLQKKNVFEKSVVFRSIRYGPVLTLSVRVKNVGNSKNGNIDIFGSCVEGNGQRPRPRAGRFVENQNSALWPECRYSTTVRACPDPVQQNNTPCLHWTELNRGGESLSPSVCVSPSRNWTTAACGLLLCHSARLNLNNLNCLPRRRR